MNLVAPKDVPMGGYCRFPENEMQAGRIWQRCMAPVNHGPGATYAWFRLACERKSDWGGLCDELGAIKWFGGSEPQAEIVPEDDVLARINEKADEPRCATCGHRKGLHHNGRGICTGPMGRGCTCSRFRRKKA